MGLLTLTVIIVSVSSLDGKSTNDEPANPVDLGLAREALRFADCQTQRSKALIAD
jgi:hypothetical protein